MCRGALDTGSLNNAKLIKQLLVSQDFKCVYTGKILTIAQNASLDHKIPKYRGGLNKIENLHWTDVKVNVNLKRHLTHNEFLDLCQKTWERHQNGEILDQIGQEFANIWLHQLSKAASRSAEEG